MRLIGMMPVEILRRVPPENVTARYMFTKRRILKSIHDKYCNSILYREKGREAHYMGRIDTACKSRTGYVVAEGVSCSSVT